MAKRLALAAFCLIAMFAALPASAQVFDTEARQAILIDSTNNAVLFTKEADATFAPASLAKLMTLAVVFNEIDRGWLSPDAPFRISEHAWRDGGAPARTTTMFARVGSKVSVRDLVRGTAIVIANDGAMALAEGIAQSEDKFAERMNTYAKEIGLTSSTFVNSSGLPQDGQKTTARDLGRLAQHIVTRFPELYQVFAEPEIDFGGVKQSNRNPLFGDYAGADGLMVGSGKEQGDIIVASAVRNGKRLIAVLAGMPDDKVRDKAAIALLDWGFTGYIDRALFRSGDVVADAQVFGGTQSAVSLVTQESVTLPVPKDGNSRIVARVVYRGPVTAPVRKGDRVGVLRIWRDNLLQREVPLAAKDDVAEGTMMRRAFDASYEIFAAALHTLTEKLVPRV